MSRVTKASEHLSVEEVKHKMQSDSRLIYRQHWLIIYNAVYDIDLDETVELLLLQDYSGEPKY